MPALETLAPDATPEQVSAVLARDGGLIVRNLISQDAVEALHAQLQPFIDATPPGRDAFSGNRTTRTGALVARTPLVRDLVMHPLILKAADDLLLKSCERIQLHLSQAIRIMPGQVAQPIHRDRWAWGPFLKDIEPQLNTIWAVTRFTRENGATQVVPGSQLWLDGREPEPSEIAYAEMPAGSVLVYTGTVLHGGGANTSTEDRIGLNLTYALGWLRQEENQYLSCPPEIARTLDPALQALIGYAMGSYALGYFTPPLPPGEGPDVVPPEYALGARAADARLGEGEAMEKLVARLAEHAGAAP